MARKRNIAKNTAFATHAETPGKFIEGENLKTGFLHQARLLYIAFWLSPTRNILLATSFGILLLIILIARGQLEILEWTKNFWNAIDRKDLSEFIYQLGIFFIISSVLLVFNICQSFLNQYLKLKLRQGLTFDLIEQWMAPKRAFRLSMAGEIGINPDQRLHEDARHLAESTADLGVNLLQATVILITFVPSLWATSEGFVFKIGGYSFPLPGYMVWAVILYVFSASILTWYVGRNLVRINANRYAMEADLRTALMRTNRSIDAISLMKGENSERQYIAAKVDHVLAAIWQIVIATTKLTGITAGYGWISNVAPYVIASPIYFGGGIDLGGMQAAVQAFNQTNNSLRWFVDNYGALADWRATMLRVATFRQAVQNMDGAGEGDRHQITTIKEDRATFKVDNLAISVAHGTLNFKPHSFEVRQAERLLIFAPAEVDKSIVLKALSGFWPWGSGTISRPTSEDIYFIPDQTYLPSGTLRELLLYPNINRPLSEAELGEVMRKAGIDDLFKYLDAPDINWDRRLNNDERRSVVFARLMIARPHFVIANQIIDGSDEATRDRLRSLLARDLAETMFIYISRHKELINLFNSCVEARLDDGAGTK